MMPPNSERPPSNPSAGRRSLLLAGILWGSAVLTGVSWLLDYGTQAAGSSPAPLHWPGASAIHRPAGRPGLLLFLHPKCPCSRAAIAELETIVTHARERLAVTVVLLNPSGAPADWVSAALLDRLGAIPGLSLHQDFAGTEASRFGAEASGHVIAYDSRGRLAFNGGITGFRGHVGDNDGRQAVIALATGKPVPQKQAPVFGCSLLTPPNEETRP